MKTKAVLVLGIIVYLATICSITYAQKKKVNKCIYIEDNVDDFTKKRTVVTKGETIADVIKKGFGLSVQDALDASVRIFINVSAINIDGDNGLEFKWGSTNYKYVGSI